MLQTADYIIDAFKMYFVLSTIEQINTPIHVRISEQARLHPLSLAAKHGNTELFYFELEQKSNIIANSLIHSGVKKEECIGIHLNETILLPIVTLGILKAGCTYVPLSADLPKNRIKAIVENAEINLVFTNVSNSPIADLQDISLIELDEVLSVIENPDIEQPNIEITENHAAYIIYTSGSTGDPKGVVVEHKSLMHYLDWYLDDLQSQTNVNLPLTSSISFAAGVTQLFSALLLGRTLHIIDRQVVKNPALLLNWYAENPDFGLYCVPTLWEEVMNYVEQAETSVINAPKCLYLSGEALSKSLTDRTFKKWPDISIWNLYGPTEATANVSYYEVQNGKDIFLGKPIRGAKIFILDENLNHVPNGEEGYIYIASLALARSYKNKEELTEKSFIKEHQVGGYEEFTIYNTGDVGKFDINNELVFLGRKDQQVKIRGYRIELSEIERCLASIPGIRQVVCKETTVASGKNQITAFVVSSIQELTINEIRSQLLEYLPDYMIPESFVFLDEMPKLANGKINRKLLESNEAVNRPNMSYAKVEPSSLKEKMILGIWENVLGVTGLGMNDDFFDLGGNSLKIIKLVNLINSAFNCKVDYCEIWNNTTPLGLLKVLEGKSRNTPDDSNTMIKYIGTKKTVPLTFNQTGMWFILQSRPDQTAYNMLFTINLSGTISESTIKKAIELTVKKHDILHSCFKTENNSPVREILEDRDINFSVIDFTDRSKEEIQIAETVLKEDLLSQKINLTEDHLISFKLIKYSEDVYTIFIQVHHIVFDGVSINIFTADFYDVYNHLLQPLNPENSSPFLLEYSYSDYEQWLKKNYFNGYFSKSEDFWKKKLENGNYFLNFPIDNVRPKIQSYEGKNKELIIEGPLLQKIGLFNKKHKITSFITLLSVFKSIIYRYTNESDILVGVPFANRTNRETDTIIGLFVNTVVYRTGFDQNTRFIDLIKTIKEYTLEAIEHQSYPFEKVVEKLNPERSISYNPLFQMMFAYHDKLKEFTTIDGVKIRANEFQNKSSKFDLDIETQENEDSIHVNFNYNTSLFEEFTIDKIIEQFHYLLEQIVLDPEQNISNYALEDQLTMKNKLSSWNDTSCDFDNVCVHEYLEHFAEVTPSAICIQTNQIQLTYSELNEKANQLAFYLLERGIQPDNVIGVLTERSIEMMIAIFAILKAGAAYLPIDPTVPHERMKYMVTDSALSFILTKRTYENFDLDCELVFVDDENSYSKHTTGNPVTTVKPNNLAYVIYTSGSTGNPKGVMIEHHSLVNRISWMQKSYQLSESDVIMQKTSYTFDVSVWEIFWWSFVGAKVHLLEAGGEKNPEIIIQAIHQQRINTIHFVPSLFNILLEYINDNKISIAVFDTLTTIFTSGEALEKHHVEKFYKKFGNDTAIKLINLYGPTEATIDVSYFDCSEEANYRKIPIGKPIDNIQLYILDKNNQPLPERIPGELCIAGTGLARGYLNNPELTAQKFIKADFNSSRLYKTGDLARWLPDGNIEFLGRIDHQVKIRGFRIELGEIENCLSRHPNIDSAIAIIKEISYDDTRIIAYYILKNETASVDFKAHLRSFLPDYMIPSAFVQLSEIPLLSNGKLDIKSLPEPFSGQTQTIGEREYGNQYERGLAKIWGDLLQHDAFLLDDNFYDVGGYSFLLIKMKNLIDTEFKVDIKIVDLFQYSTIRSLSEIISSKNVLNQRSAISNRAQIQRKLIQKIKDKKS